MKWYWLNERRKKKQKDIVTDESFAPPVTIKIPEKADHENDDTFTNECIDVGLTFQEGQLVRNLINDQGFQILMDILSTEETRPLSEFSTDKFGAGFHKIKYDYLMAKRIQEKFEEEGVISCGFKTSVARLYVANSFRDIVSAVSSEATNIRTSEVTFDILKENVSNCTVATYIGTFVAYIPIYCINEWINDRLANFIKDKLELYSDNNFFVLKIAFKLLFTLKGNENSKFLSDDLGIKKIITKTANEVAFNILRKDTILKQIKFDSDNYMYTLKCGHIIFDYTKDYKHSYDNTVLWKKEQYTNFTPMVNKLSVEGWGEDGEGTITGDVDFSDDISQLMHKI